MATSRLPDRGVVKVVGDEARAFLQRVITCDMGKVSPEQAAYGALLTPQGKIIVDFLLAEAPQTAGGGFFLDVPLALATDLMKRLNLYKLRTKVIVEDISAILTIHAGWDGAPRPKGGLVYYDPRDQRLGWRQFTTLELDPTPDAATAYDHHRIKLSIPAGGRDFIYSDTFPHEANMDVLNGVGFAKGCYVGQEVVSRMQHKTEVRKRIVPFTYTDFSPDHGLDIMAGDKVIGMVGTAADHHGLALIRIDRAREAMAASHTITAGGITIEPTLPEPKAAS